MIKNKKVFLIAGSIAIFIIIIGILLVGARRDKSGVTRYDWIDMLSEQFDMIEYQNETSYFPDVTPENEHFGSVQSAYEWNVFDDTTTFDGDKKITGEYAALTAMRAIGAYKVKIYLGLSDLPTDDDYLNLAITESLINKKELKKNISEERAKEILETANNLYMSKLWVDDYVDVTYADDVKELEDDDVIFHNADNSALKLTESALKDLSIGNVIVFLDEASGERKAGRITGIQDDNVTLLDVQLDEIVEKMAISDIMTSSSDALIDKWFESFESDETLTGKATRNNQVTPVFDKEYKNEGVGISIKYSEEEAEITLTNNNTKASVSKTIKGNFLAESTMPFGKVDYEQYAEVSFEIKDLNLGVQCDYDRKHVNYFDVQLEADLKKQYKQGGKLETKKPIPLGVIPFVGAEKLAGVSIKIYAVISVDGSVNLIAEVPMELAIDYRRDSGIKTMLSKKAVAECELCCNAEAALRISPTISLIGEELTDIELNVGIGGKAKLTQRTNARVTDCVDTTFYMPTIAVKVGFNEAGIGKLFDFIDSYEKVFVDEDNALVKFGFHYEKYKDGSGKFVKKCTYNADDISIDISPPHLFYAKFSSSFVKVKNHYEATGTVISQVFIKDSELSGLSVGDVVTFENTSFSVTDIGEYQTWNEGEKPEKYYILDGKYLVNTGTSYSDSKVDYTVYPVKTLKEGSMNPIRQGDITFYSPNADKDVYVTVSNDFKFTTLDDAEPYFISANQNEWYFIIFSLGDSGIPNDVAGRLSGADVASGFDDRAYIIE